MNRLLLSLIGIILIVPLYGQRRISADIERKEVASGKLTITRKHVCCSIDGRLVSYVSYPKPFYTIENSVGECRVYFPSTQQYYTDHSMTLSERYNIINIFLTKKSFDMGLGSMGYTLKSSHTDAEGHLIRRFTNPDPQTTPLVDVIFKDYMPICVIYMSADESVRGRVYLSDYKNFGRISLPCRQTEVVYTSPKDSIVSRSIYSGIEIDSLDPLFDFEIPASAKPLTLKRNPKK